MGFYVHTIDSARIPPTEYLPADAITPKEGLLLHLSDGVLKVCSGADKPTYICMKQSGTAVEKGTIIPVMRIQPDMVLETTAKAALTDVEPGDRLYISDDGMEVTTAPSGAASSPQSQSESGTTPAPTTVAEGAAELVYKAADEAGSTVRVRIS